MPDMNALELLYFAALEKPPADRPAFLEAAYGNDADLWERVERMIAALPKVGDFRSRADPPPTGRFGEPVRHRQLPRRG